MCTIKGRPQQPGRLRQRPVKAPELSVGLQNLHPATLEPCQHLCRLWTMDHGCSLWTAAGATKELCVEGAARGKCACVTCSQMAQLEVSANDAQARAQASTSRCALCEGVRMMRRPAGRCARMWACTHTRARACMDALAKRAKLWAPPRCAISCWRM